MKLRLLLIMLAVVVTAGKSVAQNTSDSTIIAFVTADPSGNSWDARTKIMSYQQFAAGSKAVIESTPAGPNAVKLSHMAALAVSSDGKWMLIGGKLNFTNINNNTKDSIQGFFRISLPFKWNDTLVSNRKRIRGVQVLQECFVNGINPYPLGVINSSGTDWYATFHKLNGSPFRMYHGKMDGSGIVDSVDLVGDANPVSGYQMTNMDVSPDGQWVVVGVMDNLAGDFDQKRMKIHRWRPFEPDHLTWLQSSDVSGTLTTIAAGIQDIDSAFGCLLRITTDPTVNPPEAQIAFSNNKNGDFEMYKFRYQVTGNLGLSPSGNNIPMTCIPDSVNFFCGLNDKGAGSALDDREVLEYARRENNGGDIMYTPDGKSVIFIVHDDGDRAQTAKKTGLWMYTFGESQATFLYNDPLKKERQPIYFGKKAYVEPPPPPSGTIVITPTELNFDTTEVGTSKLLTVTVSNPSDYSVYIKSVEPSGSDDYMIVGAVPLFIVPDSLKGKSSVVFTIKFSPITEGHLSASVKINYKDSSKIVIFHGTGYKKPSGGVVDNPTKFSLTISPNPFRSSTHVSISSPEEIGYNVKLTDALGRNIAIDPLPYSYFRAGAADYDINAEALGLSAGTYYLTISGGGETVTRQLILTK
ncbi:MAG TPA: T9SS type A sorting domain-containing protein [Candidatus Kapabacteria bacterium]